MIGNFAISKAGHDKKKLYVIVAEDDEFVYLSDGRLKSVEKPKKKCKKHIQIINRTVEPQLLTVLCEGKEVRDEQIKFAIRQYQP